jgi:hypothetical protein
MLMTISRSWAGDPAVGRADQEPRRSGAAPIRSRADQDRNTARKVTLDQETPRFPAGERRSSSALITFVNRAVAPSGPLRDSQGPHRGVRVGS